MDPARQLIVLGGNSIATSLAALGAPVLTLISGASDNTPDFLIDPGAETFTSGDDILLQYSTDAGFAGATSVVAPLDAAAIAAQELAFSTGSLVAGTYFFRARLDRPGHDAGNWSNTETITITSQGLSVAFFIDGDTFYVPVIGIGAATLQPSLFSDGDTFYSPTVVGGTVTLQPSLFSDADTFFSPTVSSGVTFDLSFVDHKEQTVDESTTTHTGVIFGAADSNRVIVAAVGWRPPGTGASITSVTIGGVSATKADISIGDPSSSPAIEEIWYASVPTGTTGTVVVVFSGTCSRSSMAFYRIITATIAPTDVQKNGQVNSSGNTLAVSLTVPGSGKGIVMVNRRSAGDATAVTWANATKDYGAELIEGANTSTYGAATVASTATITATLPAPGLTSGDAIIAAAWGP